VKARVGQNREDIAREINRCRKGGGREQDCGEQTREHRRHVKLNLPHALVRHFDRPATHGETVFPRKNEMNGGAVSAHPLRRQACRFTRTDIPRVGDIRRCPRPPRLRRVVDRESPRVAGVRPKACLHPKIALQPRAIADTGTIATCTVLENSAAATYIASPHCGTCHIDSFEKLIGIPLANTILSNPRKHHAVARS